MNQDEREVVKNLHDAWQAFLQASSVTDVATGYRRLAEWFGQLGPHAASVPDGDYAADDQLDYFVETYDAVADDWACPGCGYSYDNLVDAVGHAEHLVEDGQTVRVICESHTFHVVWKAS